MDDSKVGRLSGEPHFWFSAGFLIFSIGAVVLFGLRPYIQEHNLKINGWMLYQFIIPILNVVLYSCYCIAFYLCSKSKQT
ncbi:hypothetical protein QSG17_25090, partial [Escherichia coli]|nr:hypothetical protein [Escherichia coli]